MNAIEILRRDLDKTEQRSDAIRLLRGLLVDAETNEIPEDGSYTYDSDKGRAERFMVAGGGPSAWAVFVEFAIDDVTGYLEYADSAGTTIVHIPSNLTPELRAQLRRDAKAREARS
jgi:hypothetical protein